MTEEEQSEAKGAAAAGVKWIAYFNGPLGTCSATSKDTTFKTVFTGWKTVLKSALSVDKALPGAYAGNGVLLSCVLKSLYSLGFIYLGFPDINRQ